MKPKTSSIGSAFLALGLISLAGSVLGALLRASNTGDLDTDALTVLATGVGTAFGCFAIASGLNYLAEIAHRLEMLQGAGVTAPTNTPAATTKPMG